MIGYMGRVIGAMVLMLASVAGVGAVEPPREIAGFILGEDIGRHQQLCDMGTSIPIRYFESVREVEIRNIEGYKSGLIAYGSCAAPNRILRIKLKYANNSREFFDELLSRFRQRFGQASEWRGDPFHMVIAWKWSFKDTQGNRISLILQHNTVDEEEKIGNAVKLSLVNLLEQERDCADRQPAGMRSANREQGSSKQAQHVDWNRFIPR